MTEIEDAVEAIDFGKENHAHARYSADRRTDLRFELKALREQLIAVVGGVGDLDDVDCGGDCCLGARERLTVLDFLKDAEHAIAAARSLLHLDTS